MSGLSKGINKVFKKVKNFVKEVVLPVVAVAAVVWTAGAALAAFAPAGSFAATAGASVAGAVQGAAAATWSTVTNFVGNAYGAVKGFVTGGGGSVSGQAASGNFVSQSTVNGGFISNANAGIGATETFSSAATAEGGASALSKVGDLAGGALEAIKSASPLEKILLSQTAMEGIAAYNAPTLEEKANAARQSRRFTGAFYGREEDGSGGGMFSGDSGLDRTPRQRDLVPTNDSINPVSQNDLMPDNPAKDLFSNQLAMGF